MWPLLLDMTRDECKRMLRRLELEAYSAIVSAFRAQGDLTKDKKKILQDLCTILSISTERHRAEIRRAVNDERLSTIADHMVGPNTFAEWAIEGRRLIPLMPRLVPQTAFTAVANHVANMAAAQNAAMPPPAATGNKHAIDASGGSSTPQGCNTFNNSASSSTRSGSPVPTCGSTPIRQAQSPVRPASPSSIGSNTAGSNSSSNSSTSSANSISALPGSTIISNLTTGVATTTGSGDANSMVVLPVQLKGNGQNDISSDDERSRKRRRSSSLDLPPFQTSTSPVQPPSPNPTPPSVKATLVPTATATQRTVSIPVGSTPVKITAAQKMTTTMTTAPTQKVILVSGSGLPPSLLQRSLSVPIVKTVTATGTTISVTQPRTTSLIVPASSSQSCVTSSSSPVVGTTSSLSANGNLGSIVTIATTSASTNTSLTSALPTTVSMGNTLTTAYVSGNTISLGKPRPKQLPRQKGKPGIVIPVGPQSLTSSAQSIQIKPVGSMAKPTIQIKNEAGVKIITQTLPVSGNTKILPKPSPTPTSNPIVVMTSPSNITVVTKTVASTASGSQGSTRVVNVITTSQPSIGKATMVTNPGTLATTKTGSVPPAVVTVNPRNLQTATVKVATAAGRYPGTTADSTSLNPATTPALLMVGPKALQTATVKVVPSAKTQPGGTTVVRTSPQTAKPNLIVVQKAQVVSQSSLGNTITIAPASTSGQTIMKTVSTPTPSTQYEKELFSFIQKQDRGKVHQVTLQPRADSSSSVAATSISTVALSSSSSSTTTTAAASTTEHTNISVDPTLRSTVANITPSMQHILTPVGSGTPSNVVLVEVTGQSEDNAQMNADQKNTVLADILQATGILPQNTASASNHTPTANSLGRTETDVNTETNSQQTTAASTCSADVSSAHVFQLNEWIQIDREEQTQQQQQQQQQQPQQLTTFMELPKETSEGSRSTSMNILPFELQENQILEIQDASDLLSQSKFSTETIALLRQAGIHFTPQSTQKKIEELPSIALSEDIKSTEVSEEAVTTNETLEVGDSLPCVQESSSSVEQVVEFASNEVETRPVVEEELAETTSEIMGLDPQTGMFYPMSQKEDGKSEKENTQIEAKVVKEEEKFCPSSTSPSCNTSLDIFSTAIASAQLDLNPFHFIEDDLLQSQSQTSNVTSSSSSEVEAKAKASGENGNSNVAKEIIAEISSATSNEPESGTCKISLEKCEKDTELQSANTTVTTKADEAPPTIVAQVATVKVPTFICLQDHQKKVGVCNEDNLSSPIESSRIHEKDQEKSPSQDSSNQACEVIPEPSLEEQLIETTLEEVVEEKVVSSTAFICGSEKLTEVPGVVVQSNIDISSVKMEELTSQKVEDSKDESKMFELVDAAISSTTEPISKVVTDDSSITEEGTNFVAPSELENTENIEELASEEKTAQSDESYEISVGVAGNNNSSSKLSQNNSHMDSLVEFSQEGQPEGGIRSSKRKRKAPPLPDESPPHLTGWARSAMGLLQKVSTYRGKNRLKGELNASHWFLRPVSPTEAPGYHQIIKQPMDFSKIKKKLEASSYRDFMEFHKDMMLVKTNCELYNPPEHQARRDCEEVFLFYQQEYDRITDKWQKARLFTPSPKKGKPS